MIEEDEEGYKQRNVGFEDGYLLRDSKKVCYTYIPKNPEQGI